MTMALKLQKSDYSMDIEIDYNKYNSPPTRSRKSLFAYSLTNLSDDEDDDSIDRQVGHLDLTGGWDDNTELGLQAIVTKYDITDSENAKPVRTRKLTRATGATAYYAGKRYREMITRDRIMFWKIDNTDDPPQVIHDGDEAVESPPEYKWRIGTHGLPLPIFNGAIIQVSRKLKHYRTHHDHEHSHSRSKGSRRRHLTQKSLYDFFFDSNGEIQKRIGGKLSYHWHLFDLGNNPVDWLKSHLDPRHIHLRHDGKIFELDTEVEKPFKWMYVHQDGSTLDPSVEDENPQIIHVADGTSGMKLLTNADGSIFISRYGKPVLVVDKELDIYGPHGQKIMIYNEADEYVDPYGRPLQVGHHIYGPNGKPIMLVESLEANSKRLGVEIPKAQYNPFNVRKDKFGTISYGNPINLDPNGPPVLLLKYFCREKKKKISLTEKPKPPFLDEKEYMSFWIIDPEGKLIALHDKDGKLWDRHSKKVEPTGRRDESNGDYYEYYLFGLDKNKLCTEDDVCFRDIESITNVPAQGPTVLQDHGHFSLNELKKLMGYYTSMGGTSDHALFRCFPFPMCISDGTFQEFVDETCRDPCLYPVDRKQKKLCQKKKNSFKSDSQIWSDIIEMEVLSIHSLEEQKE